MPEAGGISRTTVDGVRVVWTTAPAPYRAVLSFRAGKVDETLPTSGVFHLVEHLTLTKLFGRPYAFNGSVGPVRTVFFAGGTEQEVVDFLGTVCTEIVDLDLGRLDVERRVLRSEGAGRPQNPFGLHLSFRFGPTGLGLGGYEELGLHRLTEEEVRGFAHRYLTAENAVLGLSGPPPAGLSLPLPHGIPRPVPSSSAVEATYPSWVAAPNAGVSISFLGRRTPGAAAATRMVERRLFRRLRLDAGVSYAVQSAYEPIGRDEAFSLVAADVLAGHEEEATSLLVETMEDVAAKGFEPEDLEQEKAQWAAAMGSPDAPLAHLDGYAFDELVDRPHDEDPLATMERLTLDEASAAVPELLGRALAVVPTETLEGTRFAPMPVFSEEVVLGEMVRPRPEQVTGDGPEPRLIVGSEGVCLRLDDSRRVTIPWHDCRGAVVDNLGRWVLFSGDGFRLVVDPAQWRRPDIVVDALDTHVPDHVRIPVTVEDDRAPAPIVPRKRRLGSVAAWSLVLAVVVLGIVGVGVVLMVTGEGDDGVSWAPVGVAAVAAVATWLRRKLQPPSPDDIDDDW